MADSSRHTRSMEYKIPFRLTMLGTFDWLSHTGTLKSGLGNACIAQYKKYLSWVCGKQFGQTNAKTSSLLQHLFLDIWEIISYIWFYHFGFKELHNVITIWVHQSYWGTDRQLFLVCTQYRVWFWTRDAEQCNSRLGPGREISLQNSQDLRSHPLQFEVVLVL